MPSVKKRYDECNVGCQETELAQTKKTGARLRTAWKNERQCKAQKQSIEKITPEDASLNGLGRRE
jgi:hypothetical protein